MAFCDTYLIKLKICVIKEPLQVINSRRSTFTASDTLLELNAYFCLY